VASVTFNDGSILKAGECTDVKLGIHPVDYASAVGVFDETNDYSYKEGELVLNELVALYDEAGSLIWGSEPGAPTEPITPTGGAGGAAPEPATPTSGAGGAGGAAGVGGVGGAVIGPATPAGGAGGAAA